jgi:hypothetical protein
VNREQQKAERQDAYRAMYRAINRGELTRPDRCERCGSPEEPDAEEPGRKIRMEAHHHRGYGPEHVLDVIWLCRGCHAEAHGRRATGKLARPGGAYFDPETVRIEWK